LKRLLLATITAAGAWAQTGVIGGPVLGLLPDAHSGMVRPIQGIPGAATFGPSLDGVSVKLGTAGRSHALVVLQDGTAEVVTAAGVRVLPVSEEGASLIALSPRETAAAVYSRASKSARIYTGLPDAPKLERALEISGAPGALAVTDDGQAVLTIDRAADQVSLQTSAGAQTLYRASRIGAAEFLPGTMRVVVASSDGVVLVAPDLGVESVSSESDGVAVAVSADGVSLVVANRSGGITVHDLRSGVSRSTTCPCSPSTLAPLRGNAVFRLNDPGDGPIWLLDADSAEPRVHFVAMPGVER
jgi:DNA-binding beta-propeller fold protein YncE